MFITTINKFFENTEAKKYYALMTFDSEFHLGRSSNPHKWVPIHISFTTNGKSALQAYLNAKDPATQLVQGETKEELNQEMMTMVENFNDTTWRNNTLYGG